MPRNIEWQNLNTLRNHPFASNKVIPIIDFFMVAPPDTTSVHISSVTQEGITISVNNSIYAISPVAHYFNIIGLPNFIYQLSNGEQLPDPIGYLITEKELSYPQDFLSTQTEILPSLYTTENPGGLKRIFVRNIDGKLVKVKPNVVFEAGSNMVLDQTGNTLRFSNITIPDYSNYVKAIDIDGVQTKSDSIAIFGRNIVRVNGVEFSTIIENPASNCPKRFPDNLRGGQGPSGDPGFAGLLGDPSLLNCCEEGDNNCGCFDCPCCGEEDLVFCCGEEDFCLEFDTECCIPFTDLENLCCCPETEQCCIEGDFCVEGDFFGRGGGADLEIGIPLCEQFNVCPVCDQGDGPGPPGPAPAVPCPIIDIDELETFDEDTFPINFMSINPVFGQVFNQTFTAIEYYGCEGSQSSKFYDTDLNNYGSIRFQTTNALPADRFREQDNLVVKISFQTLAQGGIPNQDERDVVLYFTNCFTADIDTDERLLLLQIPSNETNSEDLFTFCVDEDCRPCLIYSTWELPAGLGVSASAEKKCYLLYEDTLQSEEIVKVDYFGYHHEGDQRSEVNPNTTPPKITVFDIANRLKTPELDLDINYSSTTNPISGGFVTVNSAGSASSVCFDALALSAGTGQVYSIASTLTSPSTNFTPSVGFGWHKSVDIANSSVEVRVRANSLFDIIESTGPALSLVNSVAFDVVPGFNVASNYALEMPYSEYSSRSGIDIKTVGSDITKEYAHYVRTRENLVPGLTLERIHYFPQLNRVEDVVLDEFHTALYFNNIMEIENINGEAIGVIELGEAYAEENEITVRTQSVANNLNTSGVRVLIFDQTQSNIIGSPIVDYAVPPADVVPVLGDDRRFTIKIPNLGFGGVTPSSVLGAATPTNNKTFFYRADDSDLVVGTIQQPLIDEIENYNMIVTDGNLVSQKMAVDHDKIFNFYSLSAAFLEVDYTGTFPTADPIIFRITSFDPTNMSIILVNTLGAFPDQNLPTPVYNAAADIAPFGLGGGSWESTITGFNPFDRIDIYIGGVLSYSRNIVLT